MATKLACDARLVGLILAVLHRSELGRRQERVWRAQRLGAKIDAIAPSAVVSHIEDAFATIKQHQVRAPHRKFRSFFFTPVSTSLRCDSRQVGTASMPRSLAGFHAAVPGDDLPVIIDCAPDSIANQ
jgi:hypothetical protein